MAQNIISYKVMMMLDLEIVYPTVVFYFFDFFDPTVIHFLVNQML